MARGDFDLARAAFRWARRADPGNPVYIHAEAALARRTGDLHEAERLFRRVIDIAERAFGAGDPRTAMIRDDLVELYLQMGRPGEARRLAAAIVDGLDRKAAARCSVRGLARIAGTCLRAGCPEEATLIYEQAGSWRRALFGDGHPKVDECRSAADALAARLQRAAPAIAAEHRGRRPAAPTPAARSGGGPGHRAPLSLLSG